ncbi:hypothetical protein [Parageobacillus genomosp. 1]|uniref:hypothetical protein n=1 Tax=Parageobacillus genomosp. 1 TaxID=1295642 RepID=UPI00118537A5|nr:hypothetical protein [Parageobacillus genomosp. 1]
MRRFGGKQANIRKKRNRFGTASLLGLLAACFLFKGNTGKLMTRNIYGKMKERQAMSDWKINSGEKREEVCLFDNFFRGVVGIIENHCD